MAAPAGNQNAKKPKDFESALRRALARSGESVAGGLDTVADKLVAAAGLGEQWAVREVADRLDGKPKQAIDHGLSDEPENPIQRLVAAAEELRGKIRGAP